MCIPFYSNAQKINRCELLNALLKHSEAKKVFYFDKHKEVPIVFVDAHNFFRDCVISNYYGRKIEFVQDSSQVGISNYSNIVINNFSQTSKGYKIGVYYKIRNAFYQVEFKRSGSNVIVSKFTGGYF